MSPDQIKSFILAGNALFTLKSLKTGKHFTYKVVRVTRFLGRHHHGDPQQPCDEPECKGPVPVEPATWRVNALWGRDNSKDYHAIGSIRNGHFAYNASNSTPSTKGFAWCWNHLDRCGERFEFRHAGRCGRCNRLLTVPASIESGIGPECQGKLDFEAAGGAQGLLDQLFGG